MASSEGTGNQEGEQSSSKSRPTRVADIPDADFNLWGKKSYWTHQELAALSLGKVPLSIKLFVDQIDRPMHSLLQVYDERYDLIYRATEMRDLPEQMRPNEGICWLRKFDLSFPEELATEVEKYFPSERIHTEPLNSSLEANSVSCKAVANDNNMPDEKGFGMPLDPRRQHTLLALIFTMAIKKYRHCPNAKRSNAVTNIQKDLAEMGLERSDATIRNVLKDANTFLIARGGLGKT